MLNSEYNSLITIIEATGKEFVEQSRIEFIAVSVDTHEQDTALNPLKTLADAINQINSLLIVNHTLISQDNELKVHFRFYNNLLMSKMKHFFFRENPYLALSKVDGAKVGIIIKLLKSIIVSKQKDRLKENIPIYFIYLFLLFDFLYSKEDQKGVFSRFKTDKSKFKEQKKFIMAELNSVQDTEKNFRVVATELIAKIVNNYLTTKIEIKNAKDISKVYNQYIKEQRDALSNKQNLIEFEPFSYFVGYDIWKHGNLLQRLPDKIDLFKTDFESYKRNIEDILTSFENSYEENSIYSKDIYEYQFKIINRLENKTSEYDNILEQHSKTNSKINFEVSGTLKKINKPLSNFDIETMLQEDTINYMNYMLATLFNKIIVKENTALIGSYGSGAFLAILYNLKISQELPIFMFNSFPYIEIHPIYNKETIKEYDNYLIFDDTVRTGFTFNLIKNTFYRSTKKVLNNYQNYAIYAKSIDAIPNLYPILIGNNNNFCDFFETKLSYSTLTKNTDFREYIFKLIDEKNIDFTYFLTQKYLIVNILKYALDEIKNKMGEKKKIVFYSASSSGRVLMLLIIYFLRNECPDYKIKINTEKDKLNDEYKVVIDLSLNTGFTIEYDLIQKGLSIDEIDMIFLLKNYGETRKNIFEVAKNNE